jgi:hydrogenase nickel incorporation protein HypA/HybF
MHEYSIVMALLEQVEEQARRHQAEAVHRVTVRIGELSGVEPDLLQTAFEVARSGTLCESALLDIVLARARWSCADCACEFEQREALTCPSCGQPTRLAAGGDLVLERIQLEVP